MLLPLLVAGGTPAAGPAWRTLQRGVEYAAIADAATSAERAAADTDARMHVVRIDPKQAALQAVMASAGDRRPRTAADWCRTRKLAVAINLGMYRDDRLTNVGRARAPGHVNNRRWSPKYKSALAFGPTRADLPPAAMVDLDEIGRAHV